jgi:DNA adenine methylase
MEACAERLRGVAIEHGSAVDVIRRYGDRRAVMYLDPPYVHATRSSLGHRRSDYSFEMTDDAHRELAAVLNESPATIVLSGYDSDLYRELYAG